MEKELIDLLYNYKKVIYGEAFPINPSTHQIHLLLDYIKELRKKNYELKEQGKNQKELIYKTLKYYNTFIEHTLKYCNTFIKYTPRLKEVLDILKEVSE